MLIPKAAVAVLQGAAKDKSRVTLTGVHVTSKRLETTDGSMLLRWNVPADAPLDDDFPDNGDDSVVVDIPDGGVVLPAAALEAAFKAAPSKHRLPILNNVQIRPNGKAAMLRATKDLATFHETTVPYIEGVWPATSSVWPTKVPALSFRLDAALLLRVCKAAVQAQPDAMAPLLTFHVTDNVSAIRFDTVGSPLEGLIMPCRMED